MHWLYELITNPFLLAGTTAWFVAQVLKTIIHALIHKKLQWERMVGDGGMPSGHSATVTAVATMSLLCYGPGSFAFAIAPFWPLWCATMPWESAARQAIMP